MRGADEQPGSMFSYISPEERVPQDQPLRVIRRITDRALERLSSRFGSLYVHFGRPSIPPEKLLRAQAAFQLASMDLASSKGSRWSDPSCVSGKAIRGPSTNSTGAPDRH